MVEAAVADTADSIHINYMFSDLKSDGALTCAR